MNVLLAEMTMSQRLWCGMLGKLGPRNGGIGRENLDGQKGSAPEQWTFSMEKLTF